MFGAVEVAEGLVGQAYHRHQKIDPRGRHFAAEVEIVAVAVKADCSLELSNGMS